MAGEPHGLHDEKSQRARREEGAALRPNVGEEALHPVIRDEHDQRDQHDPQHVQKHSVQECLLAHVDEL